MNRQNESPASPMSTAGAPIQFGSPSPMQPKFIRDDTSFRKQAALASHSINTSNTDKGLHKSDHVPFRAGHAPHDSLRRPMNTHSTQKAPSPSTYPALKLDDKDTNMEPIPLRPPQWKKDGLALPSFKKKTIPIGPRLENGSLRAAPTPIRVPSQGDVSYIQRSNKLPPAMYDLTSRSPVRHIYDLDDRKKFNAMDEERDEPYTDPAKATEHLKSFLDASFGGEVEDDEDASLLETDMVPGLKCRLLPHQIAGLKFLRARESKKAKVNRTGGLLADDMGLGKTVQTMALIVSSPRPLEVKCIKSTLVVAPLSLIEQWAAEIKSKTSLSVYIHHGPSRAKNARSFGGYDVVMTTYNILVSEHNSSISPRRPDCDDMNEAFDDRGVFGVRWWRVVLDEAHTIKNQAAKMSIGACALRAVNRWALTGTPIQNTIDDLYTLLKYLRIEPLQNYAMFKEKISGPISRGKTKLAMKRLGTILSKIMIRRTKAVLNDAKSGENAKFKLPPRTVKHIQADFSPAEREFYAGLEARADKTLAQMKTNGDVGYMSVLVLLLRLRQACNHTQLVSKQLSASEYTVDAASISPVKKNDKQVDDLADLFSGIGVSPVKAETKPFNGKCSICMCYLSIEESRGPNCADCEAAITKARRASSEPLDKRSSLPGTTHLEVSAKLHQLLRVLRDEEEREDINLEGPKSPRKTIIFSQWTSMLDLVEPFLRAEGIGYCKYYGSMPNKVRESSLQSLKTNPHTQILLCSLKAGALGLNLTAASRIVMLDVWWNPQIEEQAIDRVHRIGQTRDVVVYKITVRGTVEDRILALQEAKREIATSALGEGGTVSRKLGLHELLALFRPEAERELDA